MSLTGVYIYTHIWMENVHQQVTKRARETESEWEEKKKKKKRKSAFCAWWIEVYLFLKQIDDGSGMMWRWDCVCGCSEEK